VLQFVFVCLVKWLNQNCEDTYTLGRNFSLRFSVHQISPPSSLSTFEHKKSGPKITIPTHISTHSISTQPVPINPGRGTEEF